MALLIISALILIIFIAGCSESGCSGGCSGNENCNCVADSSTGTTVAGQKATYHYECSKSDSGCGSGCSSCSSSDSKDGKVCNKP